jgi:Subtilisin inhibitor-like
MPIKGLFVSLVTAAALAPTASATPAAAVGAPSESPAALRKSGSPAALRRSSEPSAPAGEPGAPTDGYASGSGRPDGADPSARFTVSYRADAGFAAAVTLECDPAGGGHPRAAEACALLDTAGGDPDRIPQPPTACIMIYMPVRAEVTGTWHGSPITWQHRYGNACEMRRALGVLIAF